MVQQLTDGDLTIFRVLIAGYLPRFQIRVDICIQVNPSILDEPHHGHRRQRFAHGCCIKESVCCYVWPFEANNAVALCPLDMSVVNGGNTYSGDMKLGHLQLQRHPVFRSALDQCLVEQMMFYSYFML